MTEPAKRASDAEWLLSEADKWSELIGFGASRADNIEERVARLRAIAARLPAEAVEMDWPTSNELWWVVSDILDSVVYAFVVDDERMLDLINGGAQMGDVVITVLGLHSLTDGYWPRKEFERKYGKARFAKLGESNPLLYRQQPSKES